MTDTGLAPRGRAIVFDFVRFRIILEANMHTKIIMTPDKIQGYLKSKIYFRMCAMCDATQKIEQGMSDDTWNHEATGRALKSMGNKPTTTLCPECFEKHKILFAAFMDRFK